MINNPLTNLRILKGPKLGNVVEAPLMADGSRRSFKVLRAHARPQDKGDKGVLRGQGRAGP